MVPNKPETFLAFLNHILAKRKFFLFSNRTGWALISIFPKCHINFYIFERYYGTKIESTLENLFEFLWFSIYLLIYIGRRCLDIMIFRIFRYCSNCLLKVQSFISMVTYPQHSPRLDGVHPINIGPHPGRTECTPRSIWTPFGAVMKDVLWDQSFFTMRQYR